MTKYVVSVEEKLYREIVVEADNEEEAEKKLNQAYKAGRVVLDSEDFIGHNVATIAKAGKYSLKYCDSLEDYL